MQLLKSFVRTRVVPSGNRMGEWMHLGCKSFLHTFGWRVFLPTVSFSSNVLAGS